MQSCDIDDKIFKVGFETAFNNEQTEEALVTILV